MIEDRFVASVDFGLYAIRILIVSLSIRPNDILISRGNGSKSLVGASVRSKREEPVYA
jgi:hypothetical protein